MMGGLWSNYGPSEGGAEALDGWSCGCGGTVRLTRLPRPSVRSDWWVLCLKHAARQCSLAILAGGGLQLKVHVLGKVCAQIRERPFGQDRGTLSREGEAGKLGPRLRWAKTPSRFQTLHRRGIGGLGRWLDPQSDPGSRPVMRLATE